MKAIHYTKESKQAAGKVIAEIAEDENNGIAPRERIALTIAAMSFLMGFSDEGIRIFARGDSEKAAVTAKVFPKAITGLVVNWWTNPEMTEAFPWLTMLYHECNGCDKHYQADIDWNFVLHEYIKAGRLLVEEN